MEPQKSCNSAKREKTHMISLLWPTIYLEQVAPLTKERKIRRRKQQKRKKNKERAKCSSLPTKEKERNNFKK